MNDDRLRFSLERYYPRGSIPTTYKVTLRVSEIGDEMLRMEIHRTENGGRSEGFFGQGITRDEAMRLYDWLEDVLTP